MLTTARRFAAAGLGVLAVLHNPNLAAVYADRVCVLDGGRVVADGAPEAVLTADLFAAVFGLRATVIEHPHHGRPILLPG